MGGSNLSSGGSGGTRSRRDGSQAQSGPRGSGNTVRTQNGDREGVNSGAGSNRGSASRYSTNYRGNVNAGGSAFMNRHNSAINASIAAQSRSPNGSRFWGGNNYIGRGGYGGYLGNGGYGPYGGYGYSPYYGYGGPLGILGQLGLNALGYGGYGYGPYAYGGGYGLGGYGLGGYGNGGYGGGYANYDYSTNSYVTAAASDQTQTAQSQPVHSQSSPSSFEEAGERAFKEGRYQDAVYNWRHAALDQEQNGALVLLLGQALFASGQYQDAAGATEAGMAQLPPDQWGVVVKNYEDLYSSRQAYTDQLRTLEAARKAKPDDPALRFLLGYHYFYLGYPSEAQQELERAMALQPKDLVAKDLLALTRGEKPSGPQPTTADRRTMPPPSEQRSQ